MIPHLLRSLFLAGMAGFIAPTLVLGLLLSSACILGLCPGVDELGQVGAGRILQFLNVFGTGNPVRGFAVLGTVGGLVGMLFDTYAMLAPSRSLR